MLIVDDRASYARLMTRLAHLALDPDVRVVTEQDGRTAITRLQVQRFDVIVTDLRMPGATGLDVARMARRASPPSEIVLVTAHVGEDELRDLARDAGISACLRKPFDPDEAIRVIRDAAIAARRSAVSFAEEEQPETPASMGGDARDEC